MIPDRYEAMTRIHVDTENLLTPLLRNIAIQTDMQKQLEVLQRTLLNRNNMAHVAHATDLDLNLRNDSEKEQLYDALTKRIAIKSEGQNLFTVSFSDANPKLAKRVVETALNIFVETNLGQNRSSMESARTFIENQIADYVQKLKDAEQRLAAYKSQHVDVLAGSGGNTNFSGRLDAVRQEAAAAKAKYEDSAAALGQLRGSLATTPQYLEVDMPPQVVIANSGAPTAETARGRVQQLRQELNGLLSRYTEHYPDVVSTTRALAKAEEEAAAEEKAKQAGGGIVSGTGHRISNPVYEQLKLRVLQTEADVTQAERRMKAAAAEMERLQGLAEIGPKVEIELADLNREYGVIKAKYEELLARRESARISEAVEAAGDKVQFRVIEAPQVPAFPNFPNRPLFLTVVLAGAVIAGCGLVFLLHKFDDTIGNLTVLTEDFGIRVLGTVSSIESLERAATRRQNGKKFAIASGSLVTAYGFVMVMTQMHHWSNLLKETPVPSILKRFLDHAG